jgi:lipid A ethanolaminephosphotransferase
MKIKIELWLFNLLVTLYIVAFLNAPVWKFFWILVVIDKLFPFSFLAIFALIFICLIYIGIAIFSIPIIHKAILSVVIIAAAFAQYFMLKYSIVVDHSMVENVMESDFKEFSELLSIRMLFFVTSLGLVPTLFLCACNVVYPNTMLRFLKFFITIALTLVLMLGLVFYNYKGLSSVFRNHREIRHKILPNNFIYGTYKIILPMMHKNKEKFVPTEARKNAEWSEHKRRSIFVFVLGEAARAKNFSLNGYARETNPQLKLLDVINYSNTYSCGTSTAASVPCIFSSLGKSSFTKDKQAHSDNLLGLLKSSGIRPIWIENNSDCKGVCTSFDTIYTKNYLETKSITEEIYDETMLDIIKEQLAKNKDEDLFIILHQKGSHGPAYHLRTPESFKVFTPYCKTAELQKCSSDAVVNSYDNTILYTDYFLAELIRLLAEQKDANTAMLYASDHGESLGENGIYLHGMPYMIAPKEQKHIQMLAWISDNYADDFHLDRKCISLKKYDELHHDNIFHSILDVLKIKTKVLKHGLSIFNKCDKAQLSKS